MLMLLFSLVLCCFSQNFVDSTVGSITSLYYDTTATTSSNFITKSESVYYNTYTYTYTYYYILNNYNYPFSNKEIIIDFTNYPAIDSYHYTYAYFYGSSASANLETVRVKPLNLNYFMINTYSMNDNVHFYYGCYGEFECTSYNSVYTYIYSHSFTLFLDEKQSYIYLYMYQDNSINGYPYVFIGGLTHYSAYVYCYISQNFNKAHFISLSGSYYLITSENKNLSPNYVYYYDYETRVSSYDSFYLRSVCSRKDTDRNVIFYVNHPTYTNCSCWTKNNDTSITINSVFNYPDCNYNSTMFDLVIPSSSDTYLLSDDLLEWYSIVFTTSSQSIQINVGKTLVIDELNINQEYISFNENVYVTNLLVTTPGASFETLNFIYIDYSLINPIHSLFNLMGTTTTLSSFGLEQIGNDVFIKTSCIYDGSNYVDRLNLTMDECMTYWHTLGNSYSLHILTTTYSTSLKEYWNFFYGEVNANVCEFEDKTITVDGTLYCTTMNIDSNTKLIINGELIIDTLIVNDLMNDNLNENGIIESFGSISITTIEIATTQSNCFELISSSSTLSQPSINSDYSQLLLSQNHLLRICPSSNTNYSVQCGMNKTLFEPNSFDLIHCPCIDENCLINVGVNEVDSRNISFSGSFQININTTIFVSNKTTTFNIGLEDENVGALLITESEGFLQNSPILPKQITNTKNVIISNDYYCRALMITNNEDVCLICDALYNYYGYCTNSYEQIPNCYLQTSNGCEECYEGYENKIIFCEECPSNCLRCLKGECLNCEMNYQLNETNQCEAISNPISSFDNNKILKCNDGYYSNTNECILCSDSNCITCNSSQCLTCNTNYTLNTGSCQLIELNNGEEIISNYGVIDCIAGCYSNNSQCINCSLTFHNCELCNINECLNCNEGYLLLDDGSCSLNTQCIVEDSKCLSCIDKGSWFNGNECISCGDNCKNCVNYECIECNDDYELLNKSCVQKTIPSNCVSLNNYENCQRCSDGYYLTQNDILSTSLFSCYTCPNGCSTCYNETYCFECNDGYMLNLNNECVDMSHFNANCKNAIPGSSGGCAICNEGYYRDQTFCMACISNCTKCNNDKNCIICESNYFLLNDASECISYDELTNCETLTPNGCIKCSDGYYLNNQYCTLCSDTTENCDTCSYNGECLTCQNDYILIDEECIHYQLIDNCKESKDSKCSSCSFWHTLNEDQTGCDTQVVWWVIVLIILFILSVITSIFILIMHLTKLYLDHKKFEKQRKVITIFDMKTSNIKFNATNNKDVVMNKYEILFNDESEEIGVNEETRDLICVGNTSKHTIKVQFSVKDGCDKYEIRTNPQLITIPKGKAIEFEIFIKPLCTCKINDQIMLISVDLSKGKTITTPINVNTHTIMTTHLDYDELIEEDKLGEGSFGIVYKGTFRGKKVAIKKMKQSLNNNSATEEFSKEVAMLDKFRSDYIVYFYGAVMIPNKICMVTEFAQYGSLQDLIDKTKEKPIDNTTKIKILIDAAKGIEYLHSNGILHRDIKPDNFLITSLDTNDKVNAKLTDFGASRNINMMMTNMTFTKGIGTPVYMAPEILNRFKYKKSADIYSFSLTIYGTIRWGEVYPKATFVYPWEIANFVSVGNRLQKPDDMDDSTYSLITKCWCHNPKERYDIGEVINGLEELFLN
ncbi:Protein serine/threonine kinase [Entamoeba marina]